MVVKLLALLFKKKNYKLLITILEYLQDKLDTPPKKKFDIKDLSEKL